jgi:class 3 adenylate cyclase
VKIAGDGVVAVFSDVVDAVRAGLSLGADPLSLRAAVHVGAAAAVTLDEHLDYFGRTVHETAQLLSRGGPRELVLSEVAATDPAVLMVTAPLGAATQFDEVVGAPCQRIALR